MQADLSNHTDPTRILVVEDDADIAGLLRRFLEGDGYAVMTAGTAAAAEALIDHQPFDLVLLDIMLPGESGLAFCQRLRATRSVRVIMVTALSEAADRVAGLDLGADDYICKPFDLAELAARIRAVLRRPQDGPAAPEPLVADAVLHFAGWQFYPQRRYLRSPDALRVALTGAEADLLLAFCQHPQALLSREQLIAWTRGEGAAVPERTIDILVSRLRRKLSGSSRTADIIQTARTGGYILSHPVHAG